MINKCIAKALTETTDSLQLSLVPQSCLLGSEGSGLIQCSQHVGSDRCVPSSEFKCHAAEFNCMQLSLGTGHGWHQRHSPSDPRRLATFAVNKPLRVGAAFGSSRCQGQVCMPYTYGITLMERVCLSRTSPTCYRCKFAPAIGPGKAHEPVQRSRPGLP